MVALRTPTGPGGVEIEGLVILGQLGRRSISIGGSLDWGKGSNHLDDNWGLAISLPSGGKVGKGVCLLPQTIAIMAMHQSERQSFEEESGSH